MICEKGLPKRFVQVFWGVSGTGSLLIGDREQTMGPGVVAIRLSGMGHRYRAHDILAYALLSRIGADRPTQETVHPHVARAMETIRRRWPEAGFGVTSLADSMGAHRSPLCRLFRRDMGISPIQYLLRLRVQNAMSLPKQTRLSAAEIAARCGFADANYFSRVIHRVAGQSPRTFRRW